MTQPLDRMTAHVLAGGLLLSTGLLVAGAVLALVDHAPLAESGLSLADIPRAIGALEPSGFFYLGLIILLATPVARVVALTVSFARRKSWLFCFLGLVVLVILVSSVILGLEV